MNGTVTVNPTGEEAPDRAYKKAQGMHEKLADKVDTERERQRGKWKLKLVAKTE